MGFKRYVTFIKLKGEDEANNPWPLSIRAVWVEAPSQWTAYSIEDP